MAKKAAKKTTGSPRAKTTTKGKSASKKKLTKESPKTVVAEIVEEDLPSLDLPADSLEKAEKIPVDLDVDPIALHEKSLTVSTPASSERLPASVDPMTLYLSEVRKYPVLSREEEQELARRYYESKDPEAAQALVKANLRFVIKIAAEYSKYGAKLIDLVQEGNIGLMHAVREFNPYKGTRLITYAVWWIRGYIQEYLMRQYSLVRIGTTQTQRRLFYQLQKQKEALEAMGDEPDYALLGSRLNATQEEVRDMAQRLSGRDVSLDRPLDDSTSTRLADLQKNVDDVPLDERLAEAEQISLLKEKIEEIRPELNERELILLEERLLSDEPLTLQEIGEKYGITREAVRQAEARLMKKIRQKMTPPTDSDH